MRSKIREPLLAAKPGGSGVVVCGTVGCETSELDICVD
jgi:hypothetical protein